MKRGVFSWIRWGGRKPPKKWGYLDPKLATVVVEWLYSYYDRSPVGTLISRRWN